jgi:hypothetical protein
LTEEIIRLAAFFKKKIAKPIPYDIYIEQKRGGVIFWAYELEVTAVDDDMLHMMVTLKGGASATCRGAGCRDRTRPAGTSSFP